MSDRRRPNWSLPAVREGKPAPADLVTRRGPPPAEPLDDPLATETSIGGVACIVCIPPGARAPRSTTVYFHGGGFRLGSARGWVTFGRTLADACTSRVVLVDYRLAPEHPFPAALHDAVSVYEACAAQGLPVVVGGDSAGGGLAASLVLACLEAEAPVPSAVVMLSPWADLTVTAGTYESAASTDRLFSAASAREATELYMQGHDATDGLVSPLLGVSGRSSSHASVKAFPPTLLIAGGDEVLLDDSTSLAAALARNATSVELHVATGMQHVFPVIFPDLPDSAAAITTIGHFVDRHTSPSGSA